VARNHSWFGTKNDADVIVKWLRDAGATRIGGGALEYDGVTDGREFPIHFPSVGPIEFWPTRIGFPECGDNSPGAKRAILASIRRQEHPGRPEIDVDRSAVAGLKLPELRDGRYWVAGETWFPTARLKETFPELNRICQKLERFLQKYPTVFDNRKGEDRSGFAYQLCTSGVVQKVTAMPEAFELLRRGAFMVVPGTSDNLYREFRRRLQLRGHEAAE
jgi:hypothetical protein